MQNSKLRPTLIAAALGAVLAGPLGIAHAQQDTMEGDSGGTMGTQQQPAMGQDVMSQTADDLSGKTVVDQQGNELGDVDKIVRSQQDNKLYAVVSSGGFLGIGADRFVVSVDSLSMQDDRIVAQTDASKEQLQEQAEYDEEQYSDLDQDDVQLAQLEQEAGAAAAGQPLSFQQLDQDNSGSLSQSELQQHPTLAEQWQQYDRDQSGTIEESEFAAFEEDISAMGGAPAGAQTGPSFDELDQDGSGNLTASEIEAHPQLSQQWQQWDLDNSGDLDQAEFSAFELRQSQETTPSGGSTME